MASRAQRKEIELKRARKQKPKGSVVFNKLRSTWNGLIVIDGRRTSRKLGTLAELPTKQDAIRKWDRFKMDLGLIPKAKVPTTAEVVEDYRIEAMPELRHSTQRITEAWIRKYVLPDWGHKGITELQPRPVKRWLRSLPIAPKTKKHLRDLLRHLVDQAMEAGFIPVGVNPISLVTVKGSSKRAKQPRNLTVEEFHTLLRHLREPFKTMVLIQVCLGLRVSELLALRWKNVDWMGAKLNVEHGIVNQHLDFVKTEGSRKAMTIDPQLVSVLSVWKHTSQFPDGEDWMFPSPIKLGRLPYSYTGYWRGLQEAATKAGLGRIGTHSFRHTYRSWLDAVGTPIAVQQKLMRHSDIRTTMNTYGDVVTDEMW